MKFTAMTLSAAVLAAFMAISAGTAEAKTPRSKHTPKYSLKHTPKQALKHKQKYKQKKARTHLALTPSMHLSINRIQTPDLDDFPPTAANVREVPVVGSDDAIRATGVMSPALAVAPAAPPMPVWSAGRLVMPTRAAVQVASAQRATEAPQAPGDVQLAKLSAPARMATTEPASREALNRFDLVVNNAPASQVFLQLGSSGAYNVLVPPDVTGSISISLKNTTVLEALEALRELFGYDFKVSGNRVFVYPNTVQTRLFKINYLQGRRQGVSDIRVSSSSMVAQGGAGGSTGSTAGAGSTGSAGAAASTSSSSGGSQSSSTKESSSINMTSDADFWRDVRTSLESLLGLNKESNKDKGSSVTLNPGAGVIVVRGTPAELRQVADYLKAVQITIERQVMIEAKIVEVRLTADTQTGVNWSLFGGAKSGGNKFGTVGVAPGVSLSNAADLSTGIGGAVITPGTSVVAESIGKGFYGLAVQGSNFAAMLSFLETQGNVQVLSSPRIATLNNQKAVLKVGTDEIYLLNVNATTNTTVNGAANTTKAPVLGPLFSGISLDVTPQIDDRGVVMMHLHPSISVVSEARKQFELGDQAADKYKLTLASTTINETDSIVRVMNGQIVAIGGLMDASGSKKTNGVPGLSDIPLVGNAFKYKQTESSKREIVILIKPTVITEDGQGFSDAQPETPLLRP
ncbi:MAG: hypothetical protein RJB60_2660 [Pseudomonadota bacterium]|jgi:MSHA biogenesis protein MshL